MIWRHRESLKLHSDQSEDFTKLTAGVTEAMTIGLTTPVTRDGERILLNTRRLDAFTELSVCLGRAGMVTLARADDRGIQAFNAGTERAMSPDMLREPVPRLDLHRDSDDGLWSAHIREADITDPYAFDYFLSVVAAYAIHRRLRSR